MAQSAFFTQRRSTGQAEQEPPQSTSVSSAFLTRSLQFGFVQTVSAQIPLWHGRLKESRFVPSGAVLVGEVRAVRIRTLWQLGYVRNQYEHRLASWGETGDPKLHCVVTEEPWYLQAEALVSPHLLPDARWERDRMGPGQFAQRVTYRFYRPRPRDNAGT